MSSYNFLQYIHKKETNDKETMGMAPSYDFFSSSTSLHLLLSTSTSVAAPPPPQGPVVITSSQVVFHWDLGPWGISFREFLLQDCIWRHGITWKKILFFITLKFESSYFELFTF